MPNNSPATLVNLVMTVQALKIARRIRKNPVQMHTLRQTYKESRHNPKFPPRHGKKGANIWKTNSLTIQPKLKRDRLLTLAGLGRNCTSKCTL